MNTLAEDRIADIRLAGYVQSGYFVIKEIERSNVFLFTLEHNETEVSDMSLSGLIEKNTTLSEIEKHHIKKTLDLIPKMPGQKRS